MTVVPVPAIALGFIVVTIAAFIAGWTVTRMAMRGVVRRVMSRLVKKIEGRNKVGRIMRRESPADEWTKVKRWDIKWLDNLPNDGVKVIAFTGGGIVAVLAVWLMLFGLRGWPIETRLVLIVIGIFAALFLFLIQLK